MATPKRLPPRRPYFYCGLKELRKLFASNQNDPVGLSLLDDELSYRRRPEAAALRRDVQRRLGDLKEGKAPLLKQAVQQNLPLPGLGPESDQPPIALSSSRPRS